MIRFTSRIFRKLGIVRALLRAAVQSGVSFVRTVSVIRALAQGIRFLIATHIVSKLSRSILRSGALCAVRVMVPQTCGTSYYGARLASCSLKILLMRLMTLGGSQGVFLVAGI